jgi:uncharacterized protein
MIHQEIFVNEIKKQVLSIDENATVVLFGSRARKDFKEYSDWDFLILTSLPSDEKFKKKLRDRLFDTELETEQAVSTIIHSYEEWEKLAVTTLFQIIEKEGIKI